jgi:hypothetical protein
VSSTELSAVRALSLLSEVSEGGAGEVREQGVRQRHRGGHAACPRLTCGPTGGVWSPLGGRGLIGISH